MYIKNDLSEEIYELALKCGYEKCGIIPIESTEKYREFLETRISKFPETSSFYKSYYQFADMKKTYPWAKSIIICGYWYGKYIVPEKLRGMYAKAYLSDARLNEKADEYQTRQRFIKALEGKGIRFYGDRLEDITTFRYAAQMAGIGIIRNNNFLYTEKGSWIYLDAWVVGEDLEVIHDISIKPCLKECRICQKSCYTGSLSDKNTMNPYTCTSYITSLDSYNLMDNTLSNRLKTWIYGCDDCQSHCPFNVAEETEEISYVTALENILSPEGLIMSTYEVLDEKVQPLFWYVDKNELWRFKVNALNAINNMKIRTDYYENVIEHALKDEYKEVRDMAKWMIHSCKK